MQTKDIILHLARKAKLSIKGRPDNRLLRFHNKDDWRFSFIVKSTNIIGYKYLSKNPSMLINNRNFLGRDPGGPMSEEFDVCNPGSLDKLLAFMRND